MIDAVLIGRDELGKFLAGIPDSVERELRVEVEALSIKLLRKVKGDKLSGGVLGNVTGTLRASVNYKVKTEGRQIVGTVGTNKEYAAVHEYGFNGIVTVSEHLRTVTKVFGRSVLSPRKSLVRSHQRHMVMPARSFLRSSLREMENEIRTRLGAAAQRGANAQ